MPVKDGRDDNASAKTLSQQTEEEHEKEIDVEPVEETVSKAEYDKVVAEYGKLAKAFNKLLKSHNELFIASLFSEDK